MVILSDDTPETLVATRAISPPPPPTPPRVPSKPSNFSSPTRGDGPRSLTVPTRLHRCPAEATSRPRRPLLCSAVPASVSTRSAGNRLAFVPLQRRPAKIYTITAAYTRATPQDTKRLPNSASQGASGIPGLRNRR